MKHNDFEILNLSEKKAKINIYGVIGDNWWDDVDAKDIVKAIENISAREIDVNIHSRGGSVFAGLAIYNALTLHDATVNTKIMSLAASIASIIAMSGDKVFMPENGYIMVHNPWMLAIGDSNDLVKAAEVLEQIEEDLVNIYFKKTKLPKDTIKKLMDDETWMRTDQALNYGFADEVMAPVAEKAFAFQNMQFKNMPEEVKNLLNELPEKTKETSMDKITLEIIKNDFPDIAKALIQEGYENGFKAGADGERQRIQSVQEQLIAGHEDLINDLAWDGKTTGPEAAVQIIKAEKTMKEKAAQGLKDDAPEPVPQPDAVSQNVSDLPIDEQVKIDWEKDPSLRSEFAGAFDSYLAYRQATDSGLVKIAQKKQG